MYSSVCSTALGKAVISITTTSVLEIHFNEFLCYSDNKSLPLDDYQPLLDEVIAIINGEQTTCNIPLCFPVTGTKFQKLVWNAISQIPFGSTVTYTELAKLIGRPKAHRAVANACGTNPIAILNPCHRVVRTDGSLGGYHWGVSKKAALLRREGYFK